MLFTARLSVLKFLTVKAEINCNMKLYSQESKLISSNQLAIIPQMIKTNNSIILISYLHNFLSGAFPNVDRYEIFQEHLRPEQFYLKPGIRPERLRLKFFNIVIGASKNFTSSLITLLYHYTSIVKPSYHQRLGILTESNICLT